MIVNLKPTEVFRLPTPITGNDWNEIENFVKDRILDHCSKHAGEFTVRDLFGGDDWNWGENDWPIEKYYDYYYSRYTGRDWNLPHDEASAKAIKQAGIAVGQIVKYVVHYDLSNTFEMHRKGGDYPQLVYQPVVSQKTLNTKGATHGCKKGNC